MALKKTLAMLQKAKVKQDDVFHVCSGNIFFGLHKWLEENGYNLEIAKVDG